MNLAKSSASSSTWFFSFNSLLLYGVLGWGVLEWTPLIQWGRSHIQTEAEYVNLAESPSLEFNNPYLKLSNIRSIWTFHIRNNSPETVKNIILEVPFAGHAKISEKQEPIQVIEFQKRVEIEALEGSQELQVVIWSKEASDPSQERFTHVRYDGGVGTVERWPHARVARTTPATTRRA